mmetsp:Transcript_166586/g.529373  ORF Transcript_166586/g.529373 Transcript_166586/m.529373 type:complete len:92 (+) Transcript_166586:365-640(+)
MRSWGKRCLRNATDYIVESSAESADDATTLLLTAKGTFGTRASACACRARSSHLGIATGRHFSHRRRLAAAADRLRRQSASGIRGVLASLA